MKTLKRILLVFCLLLLLIPIGAVQAQDYRFSLSAYEVEAYIESDGTLTLYYYMAFDNDPSGHAIEYVDLGLPTTEYKLSRITAEINGVAMPAVNDSDYVQGAELALGQYAIQPGESGVVTAWVYGVEGILSPYDGSDQTDYANFQITPNYFGSQYDRSENTAYRMTIILPPDVGADQGVWYRPSGWPGSSDPEATLTTDGRVNYSWYTTNADTHSVYLFGAAFPASAVPANVLVTSSSSGQGSSGSWLSNAFSTIVTFLPCALISGGLIAMAIVSQRKRDKETKTRKMQYLPPKISVEGKGIKRGLTAVEAGILLEEPLDKVLTMILFGLLKKELVTVTNRDPLKIDVVDPLPEGLYPYEQAFLEAFKTESTNQRRTQIKSLMIDLVKAVSDKMKGFSVQETKDYYTDIIRRAWEAVETAQTPEVKSAQYDHTLEWTMLDDEFNGRTERTFTNQPVFIPRWWPRFDPTYSPSLSSAGSGAGSVSTTSSTSSSSGSGRPSINLPSLPGSAFAASMVNGASNMAASAIGNVTDFTSSVTNRTNPIPVSTTPKSGSGGFRGSGGGSSCACACACAGCACACAGGGR